MRGKGPTRLYNLISLFFLILSIIVIIVVILQLTR